MAMSLLYKFLPPERASYFDDELLRFTQPADLNDPFECLPVISLEQSHAAAQLYVEELRRAAARIKDKRERHRVLASVYQTELAILSQLKADPEALRIAFFTRAHDKLNAKIGLLSMSRRWNSTLMWSHYTLSHKGFCIGFDREHLFFQSERDSFSTPLRPVRYVNERVKVPINGDQIDFGVMFTKSPDWAYEEEERMLGMLPLADVKQNLSPYPLALFKVPHSAVVEVIVGAKANGESTRRAMEFAKRRGCGLYRSVPSSATFDMERELVPMS